MITIHLKHRHPCGATSKVMQAGADGFFACPVAGPTHQPGYPDVSSAGNGQAAEQGISIRLLKRPPAAHQLGYPAKWNQNVPGKQYRVITVIPRLVSVLLLSSIEQRRDSPVPVALIRYCNLSRRGSHKMATLSRFPLWAIPHIP